ncbi:hypothetical protein E4U42_004470 [Claviceps africana]|uniref:Transcription factor n=1 Tax=Claviceps africana TaxID=83212 RepID=A0A8K0NGZ8_9HYPO|nr:hypothetical protein E4U42_004470 [Claviceps africana]
MPGMSAAAGSSSFVTSGFSVYQPRIGVPAQFFPAVGSPQLDDMIDALIPGPRDASEKRAWVTCNFFHHTQQTGENFKFYPVRLPAAATSSATASPSVGSMNSLYNDSPFTPSWDWSATTASSTASSSGTPPQSRRKSKTQRRGAAPRYRDDLSHIPGLKILSLDGVDMTNPAPRGPKSKEQRDHAHLMRKIKACDSCRRKKTRCDPSHKKRGAPQATSQGTSKSSRKAKMKLSDSSSSRPLGLPNAGANTEVLFPASLSLPSGPDFSSTGLEGLDSATLAFDPFKDLIQFPGLDTTDLDLWLNDHSPTLLHPLSSDASCQESTTSPSQQDSGVPAVFDPVDSDSQASLSNFPFMQDSTGSTNYKDFIMYSPLSNFSEDEHMLSVSSERSGLPRLAGPWLSECPPLPLPAPSPVVMGDEMMVWNGNGNGNLNGSEPCLFIDGSPFDRRGDSDEIGRLLPGHDQFAATNQMNTYAREPCSPGTAPWPFGNVSMVPGDALLGGGDGAPEDIPGGGKSGDRRLDGQPPGGLESNAIASDGLRGLPGAAGALNTARNSNPDVLTSSDRLQPPDAKGLQHPRIVMPSCPSNRVHAEHRNYAPRGVLRSFLSRPPAAPSYVPLSFPIALTQAN